MFPRLAQDGFSTKLVPWHRPDLAIICHIEVFAKVADGTFSFFVRSGRLAAMARELGVGESALNAHLDMTLSPQRLAEAMSTLFNDVRGPS